MHEADPSEAANGGPDPGPSPAPRRSRPVRPRRRSPLEVDLGGTATGVSAGEAIQLALATSVDRIVEQQAQVTRTGDPENVHQARVASRRLRSDLRTFAVLFRAGSVDHLRSELRWLADLLGAVRDADILRSRLGAITRETGPDDPASKELDQRVERQRGRAQIELLGALHGERSAALMRSLRKIARQPPLAEVARAPADAYLPLIAAQPWARLRRAVRKLDKHPGDEELHAVRIAAKQSRYAAEAVASVMGKPALRFAAAVAGLQEALGDYNDAVISVRWLRQAVGDVDPTTAFLAGRLTEHEEAMARAARDRWPAAWKKLNRKRTHSWLPYA
jgi:CHAD domain-containing protein